MDRYSLFFQISVFSNKSLRLAYWTEKNYANCSCFQSNPIFLRQIKVPFLYSYLNRRIRQWQQIFEILDGLPWLFLRGVGDASYSSNHEGGSTGRGPKRKNSEKLRAEFRYYVLPEKDWETENVGFILGSIGQAESMLFLRWTVNFYMMHEIS